jgi:tetratricopeptide (TPR) repeat protein
MTRTRLLVGLAAAGATALVILLGGVFARSSSAQGTGLAASAAPDRAGSGFSATGEGTAAQVARLEAAVAANPADARSFALLGLAYGQRWRETGDASYVTLEAKALGTAQGLDPNNPLTVEGLGSLALTRHEFGHALELGRTATRLAPYTASAYGILGDAEIELGRYQQAFRSFQHMIDLKPSLASYARVSYARELTGDLHGSIEAMQLALDAAAGDREGYAWTAVQLGKLYWLRGDGAHAMRLYRQALAVFPGYVYALDALAPVEAGRGRLVRAIALEQQAVDAIPLPQFVAQLGDLYARAGRPRQARAQYATVRAIQRLLVANGIKSDLETALFRADHGIAPAETVALARRARALRPSILGDDTLSWALARAGRCQEALSWSSRALRLGTRDWLLYFHRGTIERCLGRGAEAKIWFGRAVAMNPHYSVLWSSQALEGARP